MAEKDSPKGDKRGLTFAEGEKVEFPVPKDHPYARFQTLIPVKTIEDVESFVTLWVNRAAAFGLPFSRELVAAGLARSEPSVKLRLAANDFIVPKGTTVTLNNPFNELDFDNVVIEGDLVCRGDVVLTCKEIS